MRLKTILSPSVSRALEQVNQELGPNALILETEQQGDFTRVIAADVEREEPIDGLMRLRAELALLRREMQQQSEVLRRLVGAHGELMRAKDAITPAPTPAAPAAAPAPAQAPTSKRSTASAPVFEQVSRSDAAVVRRAEVIAEISKPLPVPARLELVDRRLRDQGLRPDLIRRVLTILDAAPKTEGDPLAPSKSDFVMNAVAGLIPGAPVDATKRVRCFFFVGPAQSGKSTTIAKLLQQTRRPETAGVVVVTLDPERSKQDDLIPRTARRLHVPHLCVRGGEELLRGLKVLGDPKTILVDTGAFGAREKNTLVALRERFHQPGQIAVQLVLRGDQRLGEAERVGKTFAPIGPTALILTMVDAAERFGELVNAPAALELPISALGTGKALSGDLLPATRRIVAEIVTGRRLVSRK